MTNSEHNSTEQLLHHLNDGLFHNGRELGEKLGVSRSAVWKKINELIKLGLSIEKHKYHGYRLHQPTILINADKVRQLVSANLADLRLETLTSIDSTNTYLKQAMPRINCVTAETQTAGRGRYGRLWYSPYAKNIYLSSLWSFHCDLSLLSGLSLVASLAVVKALKHYGISQKLCLKWPNDILYQHKKLGGILCEVIAESNSHAHVIIGIGLNVNMQQESPELDSPWASLYQISNNYHDRNQIIAAILEQLHLNIALFKQHGLAYFIKEWQQVDCLFDNNISLHTGKKRLMGIGKGIDETGRLILQSDEQTHYCSSGDTTLKG